MHVPCIKCHLSLNPTSTLAVATRCKAERFMSLTANMIMAKLISHFEQTRLITPSTVKHCSLDSQDDLICSGCRNVSHQQQFFSELPSPG